MPERVVAVDPGHGQNTPGKRSPDGSYREYEFAGDVAARVKKLLEARDIRVVLTRATTADAKDVSLAERCAIANRAKADLFVSIHSNAAGNGREWTPARGYEVYVYARGGKAEQLARRLVAEYERLIKPFGVPFRGIKTAAFYVLKHTAMPAVLVEHAFHTNREECALLKRDDFRQACAEHIARAVCGHLGVRYDLPEPKPESKPAPKPQADPKPAAPLGPFKDVPGNHWAAEAIAWAKGKGIAMGYDDGTFRPDEPLTRAQAVAMLYRALHRQG